MSSAYYISRYATQRAHIEVLNRQHLPYNRAGYCLEAGSPNKARHLRFAQLGLVEGQHPHGYTPDVSCRNPLCVAQAHVYLRRWRMFKDEA